MKLKTKKNTIRIGPLTFYWEVLQISKLAEVCTLRVLVYSYFLEESSGSVAKSSKLIRWMVSVNLKLYSVDQLFQCAKLAYKHWTNAMKKCGGL